MIIHDVALGADREIGGDEPRGSRELPRPLRHLPNDRASLKTLNRARPQDTLSQSLEGQLAGLPVADPTAFDEGPLARDLHLRLEGCAGTRLRLRLDLYAFGRHRCSQYLPTRTRLGRQLSLGAFHGTGLALELQCKDELFHVCPPSPLPLLSRSLGLGRADELHHVAVGVFDEDLAEAGGAGDDIAAGQAELLQALRRVVAILRPHREMGITRLDRLALHGGADELVVQDDVELELAAEAVPNAGEVEARAWDLLESQEPGVELSRLGDIRDRHTHMAHRLEQAHDVLPGGVPSS